jgi:hypothetical protein
MEMTRSVDSLTVGIVSAFLTAGLLALVWHMGDTTGISQIVIILSGMTTMFAFISLQHFLGREGERKSLTPTAFNEAFLSSSVAEGILGSQAALAPPITLPPWELSVNELVGTDNALALAQLRINLERELRRIAHEAHIDLSVRPPSVTRLAQELMNREMLPATFLEPLQEVIAVCNRGIHGEEISTDLTAAVIRVGGQLLEQLRLLPLQNLADMQNTKG